MKRILYLGWQGYKNLGDDLCWDLFKENCDKYLDASTYSLQSSQPTKADITPYDTIILGGGSLLSSDFIELLYSAMKQKKHIIIWGSGHDWQTKPVLESVINNNYKIPAPIMNPITSKKLAEIVEYAKYVGVRGPLTYEVLKLIGVNTEKIHICGDPGMLLPYEHRLPPPSSQIWENEKKIVGLNWGTSYNRIYGSNEIKVEDQLAETAKKLIQKGYKIYMFIVWKADINPSLRLYKKINDTHNVRLSTNYYHQNHLLNILQSCHFTINLKLHANVISAAAGIPFITLGYRFKSFDFAHSVGLNDFIISTDSQTITKDILKMEETINNKEPFIKKQLQSYRNLFTKKLIQPFQKNLYM